MIKKPSNWDAVEVMEFDYTPIELGGHKGIIMGAEEYTSPISNKTSLKVSIDTAKDDRQPEYFAEQYRNDTRIDKRWSNSAIKYISLGEEETQVRQLKGFITAYENSNGCTFDWNKDWEQLKGKKIGLVFGMEEYENQAGELKTINKLREFRSIDKVDNIKVPKVKMLDGSYVEHEDYMKNNGNGNSSDEIEITNDMLPF
jgi:hypothetical protein